MNGIQKKTTSLDSDDLKVNTAVDKPINESDRQNMASEIDYFNQLIKSQNQNFLFI